MKTVCPGCSKHCSMDHPRCKYGRHFFEKEIEKAKKKAICPHCPKHHEKKDASKWAAYVQKDGAAWKLIMISRSAKKALKKKQVDEQRLMHRLTLEEQTHLIRLLEKLDTGCGF